MSKKEWLINRSKHLSNSSFRPKGFSAKNTNSKFLVSPNNKKICFSLNGGMGDVIMLTPLMRYIKTHTENCKIYLAIPPGYIASFVDNPFIDRVFPYQEIMNPMVKENFGIHTDFGMAITMHDKAEEVSGVESYFLWFDSDFDLSQLTEEDKKPFMIINPNTINPVRDFIEKHDLRNKINIALQLRASSFVRCWLPEYNRQLARMLGEENYNILAFDTHDMWRFTGNNVIWVNDYLKTWEKSISLISFCDLIIAPDSAFIQIAQAFNKYCIGLYGAFPPEFRMQSNKGKSWHFYHNMEGSNPNFSKKVIKGLSCQPCFSHKDKCHRAIPSPCMELIKPEDVFELADFLIQEKILPKKEDSVKDTIKTKHNCPFCGEGKTNSLDDYKFSEISVFHSCSNCNSLYQTRDISNSSSKSVYDKEDYALKQLDKVYLNDAEKTANLVYTSIKETIHPEGYGPQLHIADMGCGTGALIHYLTKLDENLIIHGFDINTHVSHVAKQKLGVGVTIYDVVNSEIPKKQFYNMIIISHFLEHLNRYEMKKFLLHMKEALHPNCGYLYFYSPDANKFYEHQDFEGRNKWIHLLLDEHINIPSPEGLKILLEETGFETVSAATYTIEQAGFIEDFELIARIK